jgi:hypothetical protein
VLVEIWNFSKRGLTDFRLDFENLVLVKVNKNNKEGALNSLDSKSLKALVHLLARRALVNDLISDTVRFHLSIPPVNQRFADRDVQVRKTDDELSIYN